MEPVLAANSLAASTMYMVSKVSLSGLEHPPLKATEKENWKA